MESVPSERREAKLWASPLFRISALAAVVIAAYLALFRAVGDQLSRNIEQQRKASLARLVSLARNAVDDIIVRARKGELPKLEARRQVCDVVRRMVYEDETGPNYIFMSAYDGTMLVQPFEPQKEGTSQWDLKDSRGTYIIRELVRAAQAGPGKAFVSYYYFPPGSKTAEEKLACVIGVPELSCYIGTGLYLEKPLAAQRNLLRTTEYVSYALLALLLAPALLAVGEIASRNRLLAREVAERRRAEAALGDSERRYRELVESANLVIVEWDFQGRIRFINGYGERLFGYSRQELMGRRVVGTIVPARDSAGNDLEALVEDILRAPDRYRIHENENMRKDGSRLWVNWTNRPVLDPTGRPTHILSVGADTTERRQALAERERLQEELLQARKLEAIGQLAGGVAHDFNNLLAGILGYANVLKMEAPAGSAVHEAARTIERAAERAAELTAQLLGFARKGKHKIVPVNIHTTLFEVLNLLSRTLDKSIRVHQSFRAERPVTLGDPGQLQQVFLNLAVNARDAMPEGGDLTVATEAVNLDEAFCQSAQGLRPGPYVLITFRDTGPGIPKELQARVFEPFFTTKPQGKGTGMGLAVVYGIVKNHGGLTRVDSEPGQGATFSVYLPQSAGQAAAERPLGRTVTPGQGRVLVVDDEEVVRQSAAAMLRKLGYEAVPVASGQEALQVFGQDPSAFKLVLLDMVMPGMSGRECLEGLRRIDPEVRVVLSTGYGLDGRVQDILNQGARGFVQKPYLLSDLSCALAEALRDRPSGPAQSGGAAPG